MNAVNISTGSTSTLNAVVQRSYLKTQCHRLGLGCILDRVNLTEYTIQNVYSEINFKMLKSLNLVSIVSRYAQEAKKILIIP